MRWFLALVLGVAGLLVGAGSSPAAAQTREPDQAAAPSAVVLVERLTTDGALAAAGPGGAGGGFVSTLPVHQPLASRVLSLAAGRRVGAMDALEADPGPAPAPGPLGPGDARIPLRPGQLLVLAVPDSVALADVVDRLRPAEGAGPVMILGLRAAPGRANAAPLLVLRQPDARGLVTSDSTRRLGLVALEDVRPTVAGGLEAGDDGTRIELVDEYGPAAAIPRIDRRVAALVTARTWAIPLLCLAAVLALFALLATWRNRARGPAGAQGAARSLLALTLALPS